MGTLFSYYVAKPKVVSDRIKTHELWFRSKLMFNYKTKEEFRHGKTRSSEYESFKINV